MNRFSDTNNIPVVAGSLELYGRELAYDLAKETLKRIEKGFRNGEDAMGNPWTPLSPETIRRKGHSAILIDEGDLSESFTLERTATGARITSSSEYLAFHEVGVPERGLPPRPVLGPAFRYAESQALQGGFLQRLFGRIRSLLTLA